MKPKCRIIDVDGTLADISASRHYVVGRPTGEKDFAAFHREGEFAPANQQAVDYARDTVRQGMIPVIVTARMEMHRASTERFLHRVLDVPFDGPIMRQDGDLRPDFQIKLEIFRYLARNYDIRGGIDDNPNVIALYRMLGIPVDVVPGWDDDRALLIPKKSRVSLF